MLKEVRNVVYLLTIFFTIFFVTKFYLSENNIERSNKVMLQHQKVLANLLGDLPTIKSDTNNIIEHTNEVEEFLSKKPRKWWILIKDNRFDIIENTNEVEEFNYQNKLL
jgi:uncharacterized protein YoxC